MSELAIDGGVPIRQRLLPYGRQSVDDDDVNAVIRVLRSDWLTTGPELEEFERAFAGFVGAREAVAVNNGTAALGAAMFALGIGPGDEVIVPTMTFVATANAVLHLGATPVLADVDAATLLLDPDAVERLITTRTRAVLAVDFAGQPADYRRLAALARRHGVALVADAAHALGATDHGRQVGSIADLSAFSLHPVKHITAGEGGVVTTDDPVFASRARLFRNHGITTDHRERTGVGGWSYEMVELGHNLRITDFQCALAQSQLCKLPAWLDARRDIARRYDEALLGVEGVEPLSTRPAVKHAYHLYIVKLAPDRLRVNRDTVLEALRAEGIGVNVHYIPVHFHAYYQRQLGAALGPLPRAEAAFGQILSLPIFHGMTDLDQSDVIGAIEKVLSAYRNA